MNVYWVDGEFVPEDRASVSVRDISILRGYGVFDFMITYGRRPFYLERHVDRFLNSAAKIGLPVAYGREHICRAINETIERNPHLPEASVRIAQTGGMSSDGVMPEGKGKLIVYVSELHEYPSAWYTEGVKVITVPAGRHVPEAKSTNYLVAVLAQMEARRLGAIEAVYVDAEGRILEGTTVNIFFFKEDRLITPNDGILQGVTRHVILRHLAPGNFPIDLRDVHARELPSMDEAFITGSNKEIVPVIAIDDRTIGKGRPGPNTKKVMALFRQYTTAYGSGSEAFGDGFAKAHTD